MQNFTDIFSMNESMTISINLMLKQLTLSVNSEDQHELGPALQEWLQASPVTRQICLHAYGLESFTILQLSSWLMNNF